MRGVIFMYARATSRMLTSAEIELCIKNSILGEVYTTPKPGLVDCHDSGAHRDMDVYTFERSAEAITPYLAKMFFDGYFWTDSLQNLFSRIRRTGILAEKAMFRATDQVNTHKGLIFTMGILSACAGHCHAKLRRFDTTKILGLASEMTANTLEAEFLEMQRHKPVTHGEQLFRKYGERGIRGEAQKGFPIIGNTALPLMRQYRAIGLDENRSNINVLLRIMMELNDTNVWSRGCREDMEWLQKEAGKIWKPGGAFFETGMKKIEELNQTCIRKNLSPGGAADLLAATLFLYQLEHFGK